MKVAIIGGGAIGLLFAAYIKKAGHTVRLYTRRKEQAKLLEKDGILFRYGDTEEVHDIEAEPIAQFTADAELVIVTVKQYDLENVLPYLACVNGAALMFVQNGMGHLEIMTSLANKEIILGIVEHGALKCNDRTVRHTGIGTLKISQQHWNQSLLDNVQSALSSENFPVQIENDWYDMLTRKLLANAVINPLTALYRVKNGILLQPVFKENMRALYEEITSVITTTHKEEIWRQIIAICATTKKNTSSMYKDLLEGRKTEIEAILGYILRAGLKKNKALPLTTFLYTSIKGLEELKEEKG